ncbi:NAD(P)H-quinone oxidoreductase chain 4 1 [Geodia barretti]|uniref:NADH-ubiquinone oxidoreductase chain 4 n=1 Tax=Geodia barretti TaxID=519541 RepID=A0AA35X6N2_GEOBA|nr:NAD(P)H-quinone oxidoreductase chain 4 1 [Geodia barretti]
MLLTATVFLPLAGAAVVLLLLGDNARRVRLFAAAVGVADFLLAILVFARYDRDAGGFQLADRLSSWIPQLDIQYHLAVDGLSAPLVLLTGLLGLAAIYSSWSIGTRHREYFAWLLTLQTAVMGVFMAQDFVLFFIFWELELIPMFFLISIWGSGRKEHSAMKFLLFTFTGSAFMFVGLLTVYFSTGTFDMTQLVNMDLNDLLLPSQLVFALFFIAFAVKLPVWPVHTWLPDAHTDAPTAVSVMLAGVLLKMGGYGLIRVNVSMFPDVTASASTAIAVLAVISILYGAFVTFRQTDLKRLVANSSISHMGLRAAGHLVRGRGVGAHLAFGTDGRGDAAVQPRRGHWPPLRHGWRGVRQGAHAAHPGPGRLGGRMPFAAVAFLVAGLASLGLPATSGFAAEIMVFLGAFPAHGVLTGIATFGVLMAAGYVLWTLQRSLFGPPRERWAHLTDVSVVEAVAPALLMVAIFAVGVYPALLSDVFSTGINDLLPRFAP